MCGFRNAILSGSNIDEEDIELHSAKDVEYIELIFPGCRRNVQQRGKNLFREEFQVEPLTVQGEAFSFSVHRKRWYSSFIPVVKVIQIDVNDVLSNSSEQKFQIECRGLNITVGLSPDSTSLEVPARVTPTPPNTNGLRPTTDELLDQCPRFRILVIGQSGVGKSTLINKAFGIVQASAENFEPGKADIKKELIAPQNERFVLHDSKGFEPADGGNCEDVKSFIEERKKQEHVKDQLHAVWLCFRILIVDHGDRLLEEGAETFLKKDESVLQNIPTIVVFTKYDRLLTYVAMQRPVDVPTAATEYIREHCIDPIKKVTKVTDLSYVAVSSLETPGLEQGREELVKLTHQKVTERFKLQPDTPSPVSVVTQMAQRTLPHLKIEGSIDVGRQSKRTLQPETVGIIMPLFEGYWRTLTSSANFKDHTIANCLAVIHTDIVRVWNFNDSSQYLYSDVFRQQMVNLAGTVDGSTPASHCPARADTTSTVCKESNASRAGPPLILLAPLTLPFEAGLGLVQWARETYQQLPDVHRKFMAYIVDLVHVLEILFALTANNNEKKLTRGAISVAFNAYYESEARRSAHQQIIGSHYKTPGRDTVLEKIVSLVMTRPTDEDFSRARAVPSKDLEQDEWRTRANGQEKAL
ncbi:hypothetical protein EDC04DRAFT_2911528 [Pisolithus marmoratus]|nr:hypothetical protein EDC04DRAFT_2911528 [Pisolithus marmoratus]